MRDGCSRPRHGRSNEPRPTGQDPHPTVYGRPGTEAAGDARKFLELAELVDDEPESTSLGVSSANAALAGIAAADAACCRALGERSRGEDHRDAVALVAQVSPGGDEAANALARLLAIKNDADYGLTTMSRAKRETALRQARKLVEFAEAVLQR
jgi:hypothetical protein